MSELVAAYQAPKTFYGKSRILLPAEQGKTAGTKRVIMQFWFQRPNLVKVKTVLYDLTCDGERLQLHVKKLNQYMVTKAPEAFDADWFASEPFVRLPLPYTLLLLTDAQNLVEEVIDEMTRAEDLDRAIRKRPCTGWSLARLPGVPRFNEVRMFIDQERHFILRTRVRTASSGRERWQTWLDVLRADPDATVGQSHFSIKRPKRARKVDRIRWPSVR